MSNNDAFSAENKYKSRIEQSEEYLERFDILETINNVGNDEVFTSPKLVKEILDILPSEVWANKDYKWLNPCDKTGVFFREIALRLDIGLSNIILDKETRRKHILQNMLYSIGLTKFTAQVARRTLYYCNCANRSFDGILSDSGEAVNGFAIGNGKWFDTEEGNIINPIVKHQFVGDKCEYCRASKVDHVTKKYTRYGDPSQVENYAYEFIHIEKGRIQNHLNNRFFGGKNMKFDIIIGNPPYQLNDGGGGHGSSATPIYNKFVEQAISLRPKYLSMIIPSRFFTGGKGLDEFRKLFMGENNIRKIYDFANAKECFPNNDIKGGVLYFLYDCDYHGECEYIFKSTNGEKTTDFRYLLEGNSKFAIRNSKLIPIYNKTKHFLEKEYDEMSGGGGSFKSIVSVNRPYGLRSYATTQLEKSKIKKTDNLDDSYLLFGLGEKNKRVEIKIEKNNDLIVDSMKNIGKYKVFLPKANGSGIFGEKIGTPIIGTPMSICTETYLSIGCFETLEEALNVEAYIKTKFFRTHIGMLKNSHNNPQSVFAYIPRLSPKTRYTDQMLYSMFKLSDEEIEYIETNVKEMK